MCYFPKLQYIVTGGEYSTINIWSIVFDQHFMFREPILKMSMSKVCQGGIFAMLAL